MPDPIMAVNAIGSAVQTVGSLFDRLEKWKQVRTETSSLVRLLYLEVCGNMELLEIMKFKKRGEISYTDPDLQFIIRNFATDILEMVFAIDDNASLYDFLRAHGRIRLGGPKSRKFCYENVLQAICFVYVKMDLLRKISCLEEKNDCLKEIRVSERLDNVRGRLTMIKNKLEELDEIRPIARKIPLKTD